MMTLNFSFHYSCSLELKSILGAPASRYLTELQKTGSNLGLPGLNLKVWVFVDWLSYRSVSSHIVSYFLSIKIPSTKYANFRPSTPFAVHQSFACKLLLFDDRHSSAINVCPISSWQLSKHSYPRFSTSDSAYRQFIPTPRAVSSSQIKARLLDCSTV